VAVLAKLEAGSRGVDYLPSARHNAVVGDGSRESIASAGTS